MATIGIVAAKGVGTISGNNPMQLVLPEGPTVTAKKGELAILSAGKVIEASDNPTDILGFFAEDAHNIASPVESDVVAVEIANGDTLFELNLTNSAGAGVVTALTDIGRGVALFRDTTNSLVTAYFGTGANIRGRIVAHSKKDAVGDTGGRVLVMILPKYRTIDITS